MGNLDTVVKSLQKKYKGDLKIGTNIIGFQTEKIPFTSHKMNWMTYGGLPRGYTTEFYGKAGSGKTTTALDVVSNAIKLFKTEHEERIKELESASKLTAIEKAELSTLHENGAKRVVWLDAENTLKKDWATKLNVDCDELIIVKPLHQSAEEIFQITLDMIDTGEVGMFVLDSIGCLLSDAELQSDMEKQTMAGIAKSLTRFSKNLSQLCAKHDCTFIGINQVRDNINATYGTAVDTVGGNAWKHQCMMRLLFKKGSLIDDSGKEVASNFANPAGNRVNVKIMKSKSDMPNRTNGQYTINYRVGIDVIADAIDIAKEYTLIIQQGAWFYMMDEEGAILQENGEDVKSQGLPKLIEYLKNNPEALNKLNKRIQLKIDEDD